MLSDACWTGINESATFSVAFSSLESGGKLTYLLRTPDNLTNILGLSHSLPIIWYPFEELRLFELWIFPSPEHLVDSFFLVHRILFRFPDPPSSAQWKTIVAIAAVPSNSSILTYFQPAPPQTNITSYLITLHANQTSPGFHLNQTLFNVSFHLPIPHPAHGIIFHIHPFQNGTAFQFHEVPCPETFFLTVRIM